MTEHIKADIDPEKAPETAENIREYVRKHGAAGLTTTLGNLNSDLERDARRKEAIGHLPRRTQMARDEEPPARFRKPGDPFTIRETTVTESRSQGGVLVHAIWKARKIGKSDTIISQGIKGEDLQALEGPAGAAKARHAENKRKREETERAKERATAGDSKRILR
ncbi:hypothetical protein MGYG_01026 [Nannizzia gypsea CBS 118893]|uniref:Uncharacterized protein n=1 Tax=Arthroderma gypseum (strain ATCC MYA-4604 / CBS 118893) TaxID=535722 RepID=E5R3T0_ARTGP|nr:hypothetical protein MGYG_01026 [Nannizzia gypsea CBS 118893]EFQ97990.1 hypothetical protein MGYG_01026 [Nannizzia gypsea CBS 118893]